MAQYAHAPTQLPHVPGVTGQYVAQNGDSAGAGPATTMHHKATPRPPIDPRVGSDVRRFHKLERRMEMAEKANHALFDEAVRCPFSPPCTTHPHIAWVVVLVSSQHTVDSARLNCVSRDGPSDGVRVW